VSFTKEFNKEQRRRALPMEGNSRSQGAEDRHVCCVGTGGPGSRLARALGAVLWGEGWRASEGSTGAHPSWTAGWSGGWLSSPELTPSSLLEALAQSAP
jgi:hypothetical protein